MIHPEKFFKIKIKYKLSFKCGLKICSIDLKGSIRDYFHWVWLIKKIVEIFRDFKNKNLSNKFEISNQIQRNTISRKNFIYLPQNEWR